MQAKYISYQQTNSFSPIVLDYIQGKESLSPFYQYPVNLSGFEQAIDNRKVICNRSILVEVLKKQYAGLETAALVSSNIDLLADEKTFTITTGHQLNLFTGPLYFISGI
jgi:uncharacterized protein YllA (UPF0747 family)